MRDLWWWMDFAACAEVGPDLFFVEPNQQADAELAKQFCRRCPVRRQCLEYAVSNRFVNGIWGGTTGNERARIWRAKKALENDPDFDNISDFIRAMLYQLAKEEGERNRATQAQKHSI